MAKAKFLLEVGVEEVPDWMLPPAVDHLRAQVEQLIAPLGGKVTLAEATSRRLAIIAEKISEREADRTEVVKGPPVAAPPQAVEGFARKQGLSADQLEQKDGYWQVKRIIPGRQAKSLLAEKVPDLIEEIPWPKSMYWKRDEIGPGFKFIRPIRWLICLLGKEVVPFEINGVKTSDFTMGHRRIGKRKPLKVSISSYEKTLAKNGVILRAEERRKKIHDEVAALGGQIDDALLETHVYLNEFPHAIGGEFATEYLSLPEEVLVTVMRHHQKYFAVYGPDGLLAAQFVAVTNTPGDPDVIRTGNERVLRARFNDARFFFDVDQKKKLEDRVEDLRHVTFHKEIGSYYEKALRMVALCDDESSRRAALLSKADLTTDMVKEFTELQGVVGGRYAEVQGESEEVAKAIYDHYKPVSMEDEIPSTAAGQKVALADKIDTLTEMFRIGQIPSGSKDPFALRRAAQGVIRILVEGDASIPVPNDPKLKEFLLDRVRYYFKDVKGYAYDEVNAVLASGVNNLKEVAAKLKAVQAVRKTENFEPLAASFKRIKNILKQANFTGGGEVNPVLLEEGPEQRLFEAKKSIQLTGDYSVDLVSIASLRPAVDAFFDKVMVNVEDAAIRQNRLTLLSSLLRDFSGIADFSEIVTNQ